MRIFYRSLLGGVALLGVSAVPASQKPCRSPDGKIIVCSKPLKAATPRCKDEKGRFVPCKPTPVPAIN